MGDVLAVVLAGGAGERLSILSAIRSKPAVPFGGKYRLIDFSLSNCANSGIDDVLVLTQYNPRSLNDHIGTGRPVGLRPACGAASRSSSRTSRPTAAAGTAEPPTPSATTSTRSTRTAPTPSSSSAATTSTRWTTGR